MTPNQLSALIEIRNLLKEAYDDYFKRSDGYHKNGEGFIEVHYAGYFKFKDNPSSIKANGIGIYSYVLGPSRMHHWWSCDGSSNSRDKFTNDKDPIRCGIGGC